MTPHDSFDSCLDAFARAVGASLPERAGGDPVVLSFDGLEVEFREDADGQAVVLAAENGAGNITIKGTAKFLRHATLMANNDQQQLTGATDDDGSYVQYNIEIRIPAGDMEKFAEADWSKCSTAEATRIEQNGHLEDRFQKAADTIGDGYKFTGSVNVSMKAKINAIYDLPTMYDRINNRNNH